MRSLEIRLAGVYSFTAPLPGQHEHALYRGSHTQTQESLFIKGEEYSNKPNSHFMSLLKEAKIIQIMQGGIGMVQMLWCSHQNEYTFIVLEALDRSLLTLMKQYGGEFSLKTTLMLGQQMVSILQYVHFKNFVHNQIHPNNFMLGAGQKQDRLFLVDFCAAMRYREDDSNDHNPENTSLEPRTANLQFSSVGYNRGAAVSRRDDMQSLLYVLLYLLKRELPWSKYATSSKKNKVERSKKVLKIKEAIKEETLFAGFPQLLILFKYTRKLQFEEKPRYAYYKTVMKQKLEQMGVINDHIYDWMLIEDLSGDEYLDIGIEVVPNEAQYVRQLGEEIAKREQQEALRQQLRKPTITINGNRGTLKSPMTSPKTTSPMMSPMTSPVRSPMISPRITQVNSPKKSEVNSPKLTQLDSPRLSQLNSPKKSQLNSPARSPVNSPPASPREKQKQCEIY